MSDFLFIISVLLIGYTYLGYPLILCALPRRMASLAPNSKVDLDITVLIPAHNEENCIEATLDSVLSADYPHHRLNVVVVSDASTDKTDKLLLAFRDSRVSLVRVNKRTGKHAALRSILPLCESPILVLADASSVFHEQSLKRLVRHFYNPKIGAVTGMKTILNKSSSVARGDRIYWQYDSLLRLLESRSGSSWVGVEGGLFAIRRELLTLDFPTHLAADYAICCEVFERGYLHAYDPTAKISEPPTDKMSGEFQRKVRVIVRGIRAFFSFAYLLDPIKHPLFFFQNISHRLLRWLIPFFLILAFATSATSHSPYMAAFFYLQSGFYILAFLGAAPILRKRYGWITAVPLYFTTMNAAALLSWFMLSRKFNVWAPPNRDRTARVELF